MKQAKAKFGKEGDGFGLIGQNKLIDKKGRNFRKEKGKFKNKSFQGGGGKITCKVNSIKF